MAKAKAKRKVARVSKAMKAGVRRAAEKAAPRRKRSVKPKPSLANEFSALAARIMTISRAVFEEGAGRAGEVTRAGMTAIERGAEKVASEFAAVKRSTPARGKR